jgi:hypothetical protein
MLTPVLVVHDRVAESPVLVDDMESSLADCMLPDLKADFDGQSGQ